MPAPAAPARPTLIEGKTLKNNTTILFQLSSNFFKTLWTLGILLPSAMNTIVSYLLRQITFHSNSIQAIYQSSVYDSFFYGFVMLDYKASTVCQCNRYSPILSSHLTLCLFCLCFRWTGICLLAHLLKQCDTEIFLENCVSWLKTLTRVLQQEKRNSINLCKYIAETFDRVLSFAVQFSELSRDISQSVVPSLLTDLLNEKSNMFTEVSLLIIKSCIQYYPGSVTPFSKRIENLVFQVLNTNSFSINQLACSCFILLPRCGNAIRTGTDKQIASWETQWARIMNTLSNIVDTLYNNEGSDSSFKQDAVVLDLDPIPLVEPKRTETCVFRIRCLFKCLDLMLRNGLSKSTNIPVIATVNLVQRIVAVNVTSMNNHVSVESVLLKATLPSIHISVLGFLATFIERCQTILLPYHQVFVKLFLSELSWSSSDKTTAGTQQPFSKLRSTVYDCLRHWVYITSSLGEQSDTMKNIVSHVISDIKPHTDTTKLLAPTASSSKNVSTGNSSKARKRRIQDDVNQLTRPQEKVDHSANVDLCISGLQALVVIVSKTSSDLPAQTLKEIQVFVVNLLLGCQNRSAGSSKLSFPIPYESSEGRILLYRLLKSLLYNHNQNSPPPLQHAIQIFSQGVQDQNPEVSQFCYEAQMMCNILIHPRVATIAKPFTIFKKQNLSNGSKNLGSNNDNLKSAEKDGLTENRHNEHISSRNSSDENAKLILEHSDLTCQAIHNENTVSSRNECIVSDGITAPLDNDLENDNTGETSGHNDFNKSGNSNTTKAEIFKNVVEVINEEPHHTLSPEDNIVCGDDYDNEKDYPPIKKRKTSDINSNSMKKPGEVTTENDEDELMKEMIASFVDSVPDPD